MLFAIFPLKHKMLNPITLNERLHEDKILMGQKSFVPKYYDYIKKNVTLSLIDNSSGVHTILIVLLVPNQYILWLDVRTMLLWKAADTWVTELILLCSKYLTIRGESSEPKPPWPSCPFFPEPIV